MAAGTSRKISAASARAHTRRSSRDRSSKPFPVSGIFSKVVAVLIVAVVAWGYSAIQPSPPKICGSPGGPPITAPRIKLRDGRHLAYTEHGAPRHTAKFKVVYVHGFDCSRLNVARSIPHEVALDLGVHVVSFDRPGYGESDPHPNRTLESLAFDIEELADKLEFGPKFFIYGMSMGGELTWSFIKYIPHRLAGVTLLAPVVNYWWKGLPEALSKEAFAKVALNDQWALRVAHYAPWLTYWWNTRSFFPGSSVISRSPAIFSRQDKEIFSKSHVNISEIMAEPRKQGEYESLHRDMMINFGTWSFDVMELENPFKNKEGSVHVWQGDEDVLVQVELQRYIAQKLPWIQYHEVEGGGHFCFYNDGLPSTILRAMLPLEDS